MAKPEELLAAGAFLSVKEKLKNEATVDAVSARVYRHPALGERPVVKLVADNLADGDDLTMEFLGFAAPNVIGPVAKRQRQALGFPGWALVNDPKHARYALELVKEFKKAARKSKAKPGHGYDEFVEISKRLGKSVAHFLPSFWEQVGREFIALDNATYASRAFGKAREAEKVHALKVDEAIRQDAFLEFALAGAVSIKALTEYGKELSSTHDPKAAWTFFRELCVRRTLGGMPPWTSMVKDIQPLLKAAKLDQETEIHAILIEIIDSPAISRASIGFWDSVSKHVGSLAAKNPHVAGVLLNMIPQTSSWQTNDLWPWLKHLDSWGILENGWKDDVADEAKPNGGPAAWLNRLIQSGQRLRQKLFDIVEAMIPRLKRDGVPVNPYQKYRWGNQLQADVDLLDLLLEKKVPIAEPSQELSLNLNQWAVLDGDDTKVAKNRPRDPVHLVADPRFAAPLKVTLNNVAGDPAFETAAAGKAALREARRAWLNSLVEGLTVGALPGIEESLDTIEKKATKAMFHEFPEVLEKFKAVDLLPAITRTLQCGIMDEYGWPALEKVVEEFEAAGHKNPKLFGQFPYLIVTDQLKAVVLRGNSVVLEAELKLPQGHKLEQIMFIDGDLLVWAGANYQSVCFWNSDPQPSEPEYNYFMGDICGITIDVPGGGTFVGEKTVHKGTKISKALQPTDGVISDGTHWWLRSGEYDSKLGRFVYSIHEVDPVTGKKGRQSMPSFFENFIAEGWTLDLERLALLPFGALFPNSPLGSKDGRIGYRFRCSPSNATQIEGVDGRELSTLHLNLVEGLLNQPGTDQFFPVQPIGGYRQTVGFTLWDPTGSFAVANLTSGVGGYNRGQAANVPWLYLHGYEVRDAAASKKLRAITEDDVRLLLEAERKDTENYRTADVAPSKTGTIIAQVRSSGGATGSPSPRVGMSEAEHYPLLDAAIQKLVGEKSAPRLRVGLRAIIIRAAQQVRHLQKAIEKRTTEPAQKAAVALPADELAVEQFASFIGVRFRAVPNLSFAESIVSLTEFFEGKRASTHFAPQWFETLNALIEGVPQKIWSAYCEKPTDTTWIPFGEVWSKLPLQNLRGSFRTFAGTTTKTDFLAAETAALNEAEKPPEQSYGQSVWPIPFAGKSSRFLISKGYQAYNVVEYSPNGQFESVPDLNETAGTSVILPPSVWSAEQFAAFVELAKSKPFNVPPVELLKSVAEQAHASVAEVAIVWFGLPNFHSYQSNFMPNHLREACKLKTRDCSAAKEALKGMPKPTLDRLVRSVLEGDPADLWESPPTKVADRLRLAWSQQSERLPLSAEWLQKLGDAFGYGVDTAKVFQALNAPLTDPMFSDKTKWTFGTKTMRNSLSLTCSEDASSVFTAATLGVASVSMAMLAYGLPVGDPARDKMCEVFTATHAALANPNLMLEAGYRHDYDEKFIGRSQKVIEATIGKLQDQETQFVADDGTVAAVYSSYTTLLAVRPAKMQSDAQIEKVSNQLTSLTSLKNEDNPSPEGHPSVQLLSALRLVRSNDFAQLIERIRKTPVSAGSYEANPKLSAPDVVKLVMKKLKLTDDAAAYYLQLLTLADPTDKNVMLWNGWSSATLKELGQQLIDKKHVLEATRARAGRKVFLPGGWEDLKAPHLPVETWKLPLFQMTRDSYQRATPPLSRILPLEPVHQLFAKAWKRITDGDVPKYEEVK